MLWNRPCGYLREKQWHEEDKYLFTIEQYLQNKNKLRNKNSNPGFLLLATILYYLSSTQVKWFFSETEKPSQYLGVSHTP